MNPSFHEEDLRRVDRFDNDMIVEEFSGLEGDQLFPLLRYPVNPKSIRVSVGGAEIHEDNLDFVSVNERHSVALRRKIVADGVSVVVSYRMLRK